LDKTIVAWWQFTSIGADTGGAICDQKKNIDIPEISQKRICQP
jgi:hypothetical protein